MLLSFRAFHGSAPFELHPYSPRSQVRTKLTLEQTTPDDEQETPFRLHRADPNRMKQYTGVDVHLWVFVINTKSAEYISHICVRNF